MKKTAIDKIIETNEAKIAELQAVNTALRNAQAESKRKRKPAARPRAVDQVMAAERPA